MSPKSKVIRSDITMEHFLKQGYKFKDIQRAREAIIPAYVEKTQKMTKHNWKNNIKLFRQLIQEELKKGKDYQDE